NANFAWVQHFIHHLAPTGMAGFVLANGSMSSNQSGEGEIRRAIIEADLVDCIVTLPGQLFYSTPIPVCLWFLTRTKQRRGERDRCGESLLIDARQVGTLVDRTHRELSDEDVWKIVRTYHSWKGLADLAEMPRQTIDPQEYPTKIFQLYSIPAFDTDSKPERVQGREIGSAKQILRRPCVLVSKLNPQTPRVWLVPDVHDAAICSTE